MCAKEKVLRVDALPYIAAMANKHPGWYVALEGGPGIAVGLVDLGDAICLDAYLSIAVFCRWPLPYPTTVFINGDALLNALLRGGHRSVRKF